MVVFWVSTTLLIARGKGPARVLGLVFGRGTIGQELNCGDTIMTVKIMTFKILADRIL